MDNKQKIMIGGGIAVLALVVFVAVKGSATPKVAVPVTQPNPVLNRPTTQTQNPVAQIIDGILGLFKKTAAAPSVSPCPSGTVPCANNKNKCYDPSANYIQDPCA